MIKTKIMYFSVCFISAKIDTHIHTHTHARTHARTHAHTHTYTASMLNTLNEMAC